MGAWQVWRQEPAAAGRTDQQCVAVRDRKNICAYVQIVTAHPFLKHLLRKAKG